VRNVTLWRSLLGVEKAVIEEVEFDEDEQLLIVDVRPTKRARGRCGRCSRPSPGYDRGQGRRRWRALDVGTVRVVLEAESPRVNCREHGPTVAAVPWARHGAGHTRDFDDQVAWLATRASKKAVTELMRIAWRSVGAIVSRVNASIEARVDRLEGLTRIGIDEISYKRGHKYLTVVVDHDQRRLVWAGEGKDKDTLRGFFDVLGPQRSAAITHVSADSATWVATVVAERCPNAIRCADPFHIIKWATEALDVERRRAWQDARRSGHAAPPVLGRQDSRGLALDLARARYALWKNPEDLTAKQQGQLEWIAKTDPQLHEAYLLKEGLRMVFKTRGTDNAASLDGWIEWAASSDAPAFVKLSARITKHRDAINATLEHGLTQGLIESTNTKIRVLTRIAYGFHHPAALIALAMLSLGGHPPTLPGRK
jgi:transposase